MNALAAHLLTNLTASMRFEGPLNVDLNEVTSCLVPFPRMHLLQASLSPAFVHPDAAAAYGTAAVMDAMYSGAFGRDAQLIRGNPRRAVHLACGLLARGDVQVSDVARNVDRLKRELHMARWNADGFKVGICAAPPLHRPHALLGLSNNSSVVGTLTAAHGRFMRLFRVRAHLHHYTEFMEEAEVARAATSLTDMISAYNEGACAPTRFRVRCCAVPCRAVPRALLRASCRCALRASCGRALRASCRCALPCLSWYRCRICRPHPLLPSPNLRTLLVRLFCAVEAEELDGHGDYDDDGGYDA